MPACVLLCCCSCGSLATTQVLYTNHVPSGAAETHPCQLCLAHTCGPREQQSGDGPVWVLEAALCSS